jgi:glycosyltransferase involved in cell wall biosynthesis
MSVHSLLNDSQQLKISVIVPTCNRPTLLREALESIRKQTVQDNISQVIVSENSINDASRAICAEYADLPITYVLQNPPVSALLHFQQIQHLVTSQLIALLHDDDWWGPTHLAEALGIFQHNQKVVAVYSNHFETLGPHHPVKIDSQRCWPIWLAAGKDLGNPISELDSINVMLACILYVGSFHWSTIVARVHPFLESYQRLVEARNAFDTDRTCPTFLSHYGSIAYVNHANVYVRKAHTQDSTRQIYIDQGAEFLVQTTRFLLQSEPGTVAAAVARFNAMVPTLSEYEYYELTWLWCQLQKDVLTKECGFALRPPNKPVFSLKELVRSAVPPILWHQLFRLKRSVVSQ